MKSSMRPIVAERNQGMKHMLHDFVISVHWSGKETSAMIAVPFYGCT